MKISHKICFGNISEWQGPKAEETKVYKWTAYLRPYGDDDISYIKKITFTIHPDFENHIRHIESPGPFEIGEFGWGEFEMKVTIHFIDSHEKPIEFLHFLKLFHSDSTIPPEIPVVVEQTHEFVFINPKEKLMRSLTNPVSCIHSKPLSIDEHLTDVKEWTEEMELAKYSEAIQLVDAQILEFQGRMERAIARSGPVLKIE